FFTRLLIRFVEGAINRLPGDALLRQLARQPLPSDGPCCQPVIRVAFGERLIVDVAELLELNDALIDERGVRPRLGQQAFAQHGFAAWPRRQNIQRPLKDPFAELFRRHRAPWLCRVAALGGALHRVTCSVPSKSQLTNCFGSGRLPSSDAVPERLRPRSISSRACSVTERMPETLS